MKEEEKDNNEPPLAAKGDVIISNNGTEGANFEQDTPENKTKDGNELKETKPEEVKMETKAVPEVANVVEKVVEVVETDNIRETEVKPEFAEPVMVEAGAGEGGLENIPEEEQIAEDDLAAESVRAAEVSDTNNETVKECKTREAVKQTVLSEEKEETVTNDKSSEAQPTNENQQVEAEEQKVENKKDMESVDDEGKGKKAGAIVEIPPLDIKPPPGQAAPVTVLGLPSPSAHLSLFGIAENSKPVEETGVKEESFDKEEEKKDSVKEKEELVEEKEQSVEEIDEELKKESENEKDEKSVSEAVAEAEPETKGTLEVNDLPGEEVMTDKEAADKGSNESEKVLEP